MECGVANVGVAARSLFPKHNFEPTGQQSDASAAASIMSSTSLAGSLSNFIELKATSSAKFHSPAFFDGLLANALNSFYNECVRRHRNRKQPFLRLVSDNILIRGSNQLSVFAGQSRTSLY